MRAFDFTEEGYLLGMTKPYCYYDEKTGKTFTIEASKIVTILGNIPSKSNSYRIVKKGKYYSLAKTKRLTDYETSFYYQWNKYKKHFKGMEGEFRIKINVYYPSKRADLDGSLKILLDCLQKVKAVKNDNKCVGIVIDRHKDKNNPRVEFTLKNVTNF